MANITLEFNNTEEQTVFTNAMQEMIDYYRQPGRDSEMANPYKTVLNSMLRMSVTMTGGQIDCARYALENTNTARSNREVCNALLSRTMCSNNDDEEDEEFDDYYDCDDYDD